MTNINFHTLWAAALALAGPACAQAQAGAPPIATFAKTSGRTSAPYGWMDFCSRQPQECKLPPLAPANVALTASAWDTLIAINQAVNSSIEPVSNLDHWGTRVDHWDYPTDGKGDCKIYALEKRRILIQKGFPRQALLMTIVKDRKDQGHAILTVRTSGGDLILDNLTDEIRPWFATGYRYVKRQSQENPNLWVSIENPAE